MQYVLSSLHTLIYVVKTANIEIRQSVQVITLKSGNRYYRGSNYMAFILIGGRLWLVVAYLRWSLTEV